MRKTLLIGLLVLSFSAWGSDGVGCHGRFFNPLTDLCWRCLLPITIGAVPVATNGLPDTRNPKNPICVCSNQQMRVGLNLGYWEPVYLVDVARQPYCFVNMGGKVIDAPSLTETGKTASSASGRHRSFYHVHWYMAPLLYWLNVLTDSMCVEKRAFDIAYVTELDPTWEDDELAFILNPEAILFANPIAQAACSADCISASTRLPLDPLFWCAGCQGSMYPLTGHVQAHVGGAQASTLLVERMTYKLHREGVLWGSFQENGICGVYPMPVIKKSQYRYQMTYPKPTTSLNGCNPYGRTTAIW